MQHKESGDQQGKVSLSKPISMEEFNDPFFTNRHPDVVLAGFGGHGTLEILEVTRVLGAADIPCCMDWEVCVPTERLSEASAFLSLKDTYEVCSQRPPDTGSLLHTFPRFKFKGISLCFTLIPPEDAHIDCSTPNIERSRMSIPYPKLEIFTQSLLDTNDMTSVTDLIDGMDLVEEWGLEHLKLDTENDLAWTERKNDKIHASDLITPDSCLLESPINTTNLRETGILWSGARSITSVRVPKGVLCARFRGREAGDPRLIDRHCA